MSKVLHLVKIVFLAFLICYPFTFLIGSCASYPLDDLFFPIYWPISNWLNHQGIPILWASPLAVIAPNTLLVIFLVKLNKLIRIQLNNKMQ